MNIGIDKSEERYFCIEDIVSYSNIEVTHVNDNKAPMRVVAPRVVVCILIATLIAAFFIV